MEISEFQEAFEDEKLGEMFHHLHNELVFNRIKWQEYLALFKRSEDRINLLNQSAPMFFFLVQRTFRNDVIISLSRMTDPGKSFGKENISVKGFHLNLTRKHKNYSERKDIDILLTLIDEKTRFCRYLRNKSIAHTDYDFKINKDTKAIWKSDVHDFSIAFESIEKYMTVVYNDFFNSHFLYDKVLHLSNATGLVNLLDHGIEHRNCLKELRLKDPLGERFRFNSEQ